MVNVLRQSFEYYLGDGYGANERHRIHVPGVRDQRCGYRRSIVDCECHSGDNSGCTDIVVCGTDLQQFEFVLVGTFG
mgnify:CR=1 FL=1